MVELELKLEHGAYCGEILGARFEFPATESNKYCLLGSSTLALEK